MKLRLVSSAAVLSALAGLLLIHSQPARAEWRHQANFEKIRVNTSQVRSKVPAAGRSAASRDSLAVARDRFLGALRDSARIVAARVSGKIGSLDPVLALMVRDTTVRLHSYADSLTRSAGGRLSLAHQDTVRRLESRFGVTAQLLRSGHGHALHALLGRFASRLEDARIARARCVNCNKPEHFQGQLYAFMEDANGLAESVADSAAEVRDSLQDALSDSADACRNVLEEMKDRFSDPGELAVQQRSALIASVRSTSHFAYRGRDNGLPTYALIPSVNYRHSSGFSLNLTRYWLEKAYDQWSETDLGAEYDFDLTDDLSAYVGYTRFWFADSSELSRSIFTNSAFAGISWSTPLTNLELDLDEDIGTRSQFTAMCGVSLPWTITTLGSGGRLDLQPGIAAVYGQQLFRSVSGGQIPGAGVDSTEQILQAANFFGIIDYEFTLPLTLTLGPLTVALSILYDIPINVIDGSTAAPFFTAAGTVTLAIR